MPTQKAAHSSDRRRPSSMARWQESAASTRHMVSRPSSMLCPNMDTATGVSAKIAAPSRPGTGPVQRGTTRYITTTELNPPITSGTPGAQGGGVEAEDPRGDRLRNERPGELVQGDRRPRVEGAEDKCLPAHRHALHRDRVEPLEPGVRDVPRIQRRRYHGNAQQRGSRPSGLVLR